MGEREREREREREIPYFVNKGIYSGKIFVYCMTILTFYNLPKSVAISINSEV